MVHIYIFRAKQCELEKAQADVAYYKKRIKNGLTTDYRRTDKQILKDLKEEKRSVESELENLSREMRIKMIKTM